VKSSEINFKVLLDDNNVPERIQWDATEKPDPGLTETKSISVSLWDHSQKNTLRIDLWTKDMPVDEMKRFYIDCLGGIGQSILTSTGDEGMSAEVNALANGWPSTWLRKNSHQGKNHLFSKKTNNNRLILLFLVNFRK
jgi:gliding motility-associated protein GldC